MKAIETGFECLIVISEAMKLVHGHVELSPPCKLFQNCTSSEVQRQFPVNNKVTHPNIKLLAIRPVEPQLFSYVPLGKDATTCNCNILSAELY
jgi:hypothetical protein